jgi:hypothetical protein
VRDLFGKKEKSTKVYSERLIKRVSKLPSGEIVFWADQAMSEIGRSIYAYDTTHEEVHINEAMEGLRVLEAIVMEIKYRATTR